MRRSLLVALSVVLFVGACGAIRDSRLNPFNWFGRSQPEERLISATPAADPRALVAQVLSLSVDAYPGGAIVRATGLPATQGWWDAELVLVEGDDPSVLVYDFRIFPPITAADISTQRSREVTVGLSVSDIALDGVRQITVQGGSGARTVRR